MKTIKNLGSTIAKLRKAAGITQERLADQLGVSVSAVSQWENGRTMPDLCTIPILCHILKVSSDELLEINREQDDAEIKRIDVEAKHLMQRAHYAEAEELLTNALVRFPGSYDLMTTMMTLCHCVPTSNPQMADQESGKEHSANASVNEKYLHKCIDLAQTIINECRDSSSVDYARLMLCYSYSLLGEAEKAIAIAQDMPGMTVSREALLSTFGRDRDRYKSIQSEMVLHVKSLCTMLDCNVRFEDGSFAYTRAERAALAQKVIDLLHVLFEDGDFGLFHDTLILAHYHIAHFTACDEKDCEKTLTHLEEAANHGEAFLKNEKKKTHTSLFLRGQEYGGIRIKGQNKPTAFLLEIMKDDCFDFVRKDSRFTDLEKRLRKTTGM